MTSPTEKVAVAIDRAYEIGVEDGIRQERERVRELLLSDKSKNASAHEMQELSAQGVIHNHTLAFYGMKAALDAIGLGDGTGGQGS